MDNYLHKWRDILVFWTLELGRLSREWTSYNAEILHDSNKAGRRFVLDAQAQPGLVPDPTADVEMLIAPLI
jgi:hypothetical protein